MKIIRIAADLEDIRTQGSLPPAYQAYVDSLFTELEAALGDGEPDFSLDQHGFIVLLEATDDLRRLPGIGLDHLDQGLLSTCPEYVEEIKLDGLCLYKGLVLHDNEYGTIFLSVKGQLNKEAEEWLQDIAEW